MLPDNETSPTIVRTYISAVRFAYISYSVGYGIRLHLPEGVLFGIGCVRGTQPVLAQKRAVEAVLNAIARSERPFKAEVITRSEYWLQCLDFGRTRRKKRQYGYHLNPIKTDEELYEGLAALASLHLGGGRMADPTAENESQELALIEKELNRQAFRYPQQFKGREFAPEFDL